ncbi:bifunctional riboflavin kinase/FAD synthetase [Trichlorobacter ammonificans]|uniref:Riboflavin biosynthesis protein n=1 Tax=Trichlorobacter ammonificans TaxID=2916410 RepID=A0ABM9D8J3_9BACT|nr:bifunctional riboflavin kinase/FAD synthetase [Trichlorobacter ammonificans]CAH2031537.1 FMN adenylyltransferase,Riboflavin kinase [Trichlorobacter ammonificans]
MRTITTDDFSRPLCERSVVTIGNFDGVHRGHREIFSRVRRRADLLGAAAVVVTFDPHPLKLLDPERPLRLITTREQQRALIAESDIDLLLVIPFTPAFAATPAEAFVRTVLHGCLGVRALVIGHDYAFGRGREGDEQLLERLSGELGFELIALDPVGERELLFSSSAVRRLVAQGNVAGAVAMLGRCHRVTGQVVPGRRIGRTLGFPTANIVTANELIPADGVYAVWVEVAGELHQGACSIGVNPTFDGGSHTIEAFLFDYDGDLYGREIVLHFVDRLRDIVRFNDVESLMAQIRTDVARCRDLLMAGLPVEA